MSYYVYIPRHAKEEYQRYTPNEKNRAEFVGKTATFFFLAFLGGIAFFIVLNSRGVSDDDIVWQWIVWSILLSFAISVLGLAVYQAMLARVDGQVDDALLKERDALHTQVAKMENDIKERCRTGKGHQGLR